jgi:hypothetical protein
MNVFAIPVISIALSIVICWALFAIACSLIHESVVLVKSERGRFMKEYLLKQFKDDANKINWANLLYHQGTVNLLSRDIRKPSDDIDPVLFARAIVSAVSGSHLVRTKVQELQTLANQNVPNHLFLSDTFREQSVIAGKALQALSVYSHPQLYFFNAAISLLQQSEQVTLFANSFSNAELESKIIIGEVMNTTIEREIYQRLQDNLQIWFEELSQRISLWYKKKTRQRLFWLGCVLALVLNVDSVELFGVFDRNPAARVAVQDFYQKNQGYLEGLARHPDSSFTRRDTIMYIYRNKKLISEKNIKDTSTGFERNQKGLPNLSDDYGLHYIRLDTEFIITVHDSVSLAKGFDSLGKMAVSYRNKLDSLQKEAMLPIGIRYSVFNGQPSKSLAFWVLKLLGILISGMAASMGAPFWFDLLKKINTPKSK